MVSGETERQSPLQEHHSLGIRWGLKDGSCRSSQLQQSLGLEGQNEQNRLFYFIANGLW